MSRFKPRTIEEARENFRPMKRTEMGRGGGLKSRKPMNRRGPKTDAWDKARAWLKIQFDKKGIRTCQLRYAGCRFDDWLSFAHPAKRDRLRPGELYLAILCCTVCHDAIEFGPAEEMRRIVELHFQETGIKVPRAKS